MKLDFDQHEADLMISAYSDAGITIAGRTLTEPFIVCGGEIVTGRLPANAADILDEHIRALIAFEQSIILIGTGSTQILLDDVVLRSALESGTGVEVMTTPAACRSYNVLVGENRAVVGAFFML